MTSSTPNDASRSNLLRDQRNHGYRIWGPLQYMLTMMLQHKNRASTPPRMMSAPSSSTRLFNAAEAPLTPSSDEHRLRIAFIQKNNHYYIPHQRIPNNKRSIQVTTLSRWSTYCGTRKTGKHVRNPDALSSVCEYWDVWLLGPMAVLAPKP